MSRSDRFAAAAGSSAVHAVIDGVVCRVEIDQDGVIAAVAPAAPGTTTGTRWTGGFVDIHVHGGGGSSFDRATGTAIEAALSVHRAHGVRRSLLSLVSAPPETLMEQLRTLAVLTRGRADVAGVHLEGPFLAHDRRGAHDPRALRVPTSAVVEGLIEAGEGLLRQITIAPELPGAMDAVERFVAAGVVVAVGHTDATFDIAGAAFDRGASLVTHAFNAMPGLGHREPGPVGAALDRDHVVIEVIADGLHVHPVVLRTLFAAAPGRVALVSDAMAATGAEDGSYRLGDLDVTVTAGRPVLTGSDTLAGSTLTLDRAVEVAAAAGVQVDEAVAAACIVPARAVGIDAPAIRVGTRLDAVVAVDPRGRRVDPRA